MAYKYYSILRPVSIGTYPKQGLINFENYDRRKYVDEINWLAWGELWYSRPLTGEEQDAYDLQASPWNEA